jgi:hypothetical protein
MIKRLFLNHKIKQLCQTKTDLQQRSNKMKTQS